MIKTTNRLEIPHTTELIDIVNYGQGQFVAQNYFYNNFYKCCKYNKAFDSYPEEWVHTFLNDRKTYIYNNCSCVAYVDKANPDIVLSFVFYRKHNDKPIVYFAYTKKSLQNNGLFKGLLNYLGHDEGDLLTVSFVGLLPRSLLTKIILLRTPV